ncbi:hypothetical protein ED312_06460 [Sinomicrobium pectinilyticum]|uniref:Uncharacterized protein n=1 Tax=Sinomicrobium pectinilyticum TaxID=1084421 RepID=A0A3N0ER48_SINP1|nr:hypothetical protein [Sinomicrobium pectinilyticum]RNL90356.1 hypothetical protein ED312_06460 [Sinomicrobium pectinilyticum]
MVYLNYNNLDLETQQRLLSMSKEEVESRFGEQLRNYAKTQYLDYDELVEQEAIRNLYTYDYVFNI